MKTCWLCGLSLRSEQDNRWNYIWYSKQALEKQIMHWQDFCGLFAKHNTRHNEKHLFRHEQSTKSHSIRKEPSELVFYCVSLTLIIFGGLGSQPQSYPNVTTPIKIYGFINALEV